ncbi:hypothetical protein M569_11799 [Genlisea aurea]|uniref:ACT domain-containing protein ACR n=1 Tax=Genlisea aurea TaxID=192259 RepID=S8C825_9LAMI|nr:hypothetical protein M569_11799 [Genlisea aurea]
MRVLNDDAVVIEKGKKPGDPYMITVNCPDKTGLGCDICHTILEFGLYITKGDLSTDGKWCYVVLWVIPRESDVMWMNLRERLLSVCPSTVPTFYLPKPCPSPSPIYLLKFCALDREGLLHDVTRVLLQLELTIERVKVSTTPDGHVLDLFFIQDDLGLLHKACRQEQTCERLRSVLGESCIISCEIQQYGTLHHSSISPSVAHQLFTLCSEFNTSNHNTLLQIDNTLSPAHTLLQISCVDSKGFLYDIMRTLKDYNIQISYGRLSHSTTSHAHRDLDLFIQHADGNKVVDPQKHQALCSRLNTELLHPLRVLITTRGPDTELFVANPVELCGRGRPRVFYDVTFALKTLGICIFLAEITRHTAAEREWEVYRFLLDESCTLKLSTKQIVNKVRRTLMGW